MRIGVVHPEQPRDMAHLKKFGRWVAERPGTRLWTAHSTLVDSYQAAAYLAGAGIRVPFGMGVALTPLVHPVHAAIQARSLAVLTGHDVWAAYGTGGRDVEGSMLGRPLDGPATAVGEYLEVARQVLGGEQVLHRGAFYSVQAALPEVASPGVLVGAGVLREGMARVAGRTADFALTWLCPLSHITETIVPALSASAARFGRETPRVVCMVHLGPVGDPMSTERLAEYAVTPHLSADHYRQMLQVSGLNPKDASTPGEIARGLVDRRVILGGSLDDVVDDLLEYRAAGVTEVALNPMGTYLRHGPDRALADLDMVRSTYEARLASRSVPASTLPGGASV